MAKTQLHSVLLLCQLFTLTSGHFFARHCYGECSLKYNINESHWTDFCSYDFDEAWNYYNEIGHGVRISETKVVKHRSVTEAMGKFRLSCELVMERLEKDCQEVCTPKAEEDDLSCGLGAFESVRIFRLANQENTTVNGLRFPCRSIALRRPFKSILLGDAHNFFDDESTLIANGDTVLSYQPNTDPDPEMELAVQRDQTDDGFDVRKIDYNEIRPIEEDYPNY